MIRRIQPLIMGLSALLMTLLLGLAPVQANTALGAYQHDHQIALGDQYAIHLTALGNFDYHAKTASECCNAPNRGLPDGYRLVDGTTNAARPTLTGGNRWVLDADGTAVIQRPDGSFARTQTDIKNIVLPSASNRLPVPDRRVEITELFDNTNPRSGIQIGNRTVLNDPTNTGGARVFSDVSDVEVRNYFTELTGQSLPAPRTVNIGGRNVQFYTVRTPDGNFNLRSGSSSVLPNGQTPSWTIDVPSGATGRVDRRERPVTSELKFE